MAVKKKQCGCIGAMNTLLVPRNAQLDIVYQLAEGRCFTKVAVVPLSKGRGVKKPPMLVATFCPFCGKKYPE